MIATIRTLLILCLLSASLCSCLLLLLNRSIRDGRFNEFNPTFKASSESEIAVSQSIAFMRMKRENKIASIPGVTATSGNTVGEVDQMSW